MVSSIAEGRRHRSTRRRARGSRLRVLHLIADLSDSGGAERFAVALATRLPQDRFEPWMCVPRDIQPGAQRKLDEAGVRSVTLGRRGRWDFYRFAGLFSLLYREQFDVLHAHMFGSNLSGAIAGRSCGVPVVIAHEHTWSYEGDPVRVWLDGQVIGRLVTRFVAVSNADAERMVRIEHVPASKVVYIPTGYVPHPSTVTSDVRKDLGLRPDTLLVATAAILRAQKALEVLIDAHAQLLRRVPDVHLIIAGDGSRRADLEHHVAERGLQQSVHFLGSRTDIDSILGQVDVAAMSSDYEGMPLFAFECMANGAPLVATAVGGLPDIIDDGRTGLLVPRRDPAALAAALAGLLTDAPRRERMASAALSGLNEFRIDEIVERFASLYETLVRESGRPR
jgi:glycosyltransferase involved in cell wall biosynthesis